MILYKWYSTADIFLSIFNFFWDKLISQNSSKPLIVRSFYFLRISDDYCFRKAAQRQLSRCNKRNITSVLRAVVKSHNGLKGTKVFACGSSGRTLKNFSRVAGKSPCWGLFIVKLQAVIACYKRLLGQLYQKRHPYTEILTQTLSVNFEEKKKNPTINTSTRVSLK